MQELPQRNIQSKTHTFNQSMERQMKTLDHNALIHIMDANNFRWNFHKPLVVVFRNTAYDETGVGAGGLYYQEDLGDNNCDLVLLIDDKQVISLSGRSLPHRRYQERMVRGTGRANRIATGYYRRCWKKGRHRGYPALVQYRSFVILRSSDMILGNEDDWFEYGEIVSDNLHAQAPYSAGCVTIQGKALPRPTDGWALAYKWLYEDHADKTYFSAVILNHSDLDAHDCLRVGSTGDLVKAIQYALSEYKENLSVDGIFGSSVHQAVCDFQDDMGLNVDGVIGPITNSALSAEVGADL